MKRKRDYQKKDFRNPYFTKKQKPKRRRGKILWFLLVIIVVAGLYFFNTNDYFKIKDIKIEGTETISNQDLVSLIQPQLNKKRFFIFNQDSIFFFSKRQAKKILNKNYFFDQLKVKKIFFNTIVIEVEEKISTIIWLANEKRYYLDLAGEAIKEIKAEDLVIESGQEGTEIIRVGKVQESYPTIHDQSNTPVEIGQTVVDQELVDFIINLFETLKANADFEISHYLIASPFADQLTLVTTENWQAHFRITDPVSSQVNKLLLILHQKVENRADLDYIDLRFGEKVFYK